MIYRLDNDLFMALHFNGGELMDRVMLTISGTTMWLPLYALILYLVWHRAGWRNLIIFILCMVGAIVLSDMIAGIFKHTGVLKNLWSSFPTRPRPMFTPELEGLCITTDSLAALRRADPGMNWVLHVPREALAGLYGTVSAHAATIVALATVSVPVIRRRWFALVMLLCTLVICYSRIYLSKHYPLDLLLGAATGFATGWVMYRLYRFAVRRQDKNRTAREV